jgi:hypothetical protein
MELQSSAKRICKCVSSKSQFSDVIIVDCSRD